MSTIEHSLFKSFIGEPEDTNTKYYELRLRSMRCDLMRDPVTIVRGERLIILSGYSPRHLSDVADIAKTIAFTMLDVSDIDCRECYKNVSGLFDRASFIKSDTELAKLIPAKHLNKCILSGKHTDDPDINTQIISTFAGEPGQFRNVVLNNDEEIAGEGYEFTSVSFRFVNRAPKIPKIKTKLLKIVYGGADQMQNWGEIIASTQAEYLDIHIVYSATELPNLAKNVVFCHLKEVCIVGTINLVIIEKMMKECEANVGIINEFVLVEDSQEEIPPGNSQGLLSYLRFW